MHPDWRIPPRNLSPLIVVNGYYPPVGKKYNSIVYITSEKKK
jgi:hypothetical protein